MYDHEPVDALGNCLPDSQLRVVAVSAPEFPYGRLGTESLSGRDPVSLYNATRYAASLAEKGAGAWGRSNWAGTRAQRREKTLLMNSMEEELSKFSHLIRMENPNLLLLGAMSICMRGAIECASLAKSMLGDQVCVVLGGKHVNETQFRDRRYHPPTLTLHHASPLRLMREGAIPDVFDLVVAGESEMLIASLGELVAVHGNAGKLLKHLILDPECLRGVAGEWILGFNRGRETCILDNCSPLRKEELPCHLPLFGTRTSFNIFPGTMTGQIFSHASMGCAYDCFFCSERRQVSFGGFNAKASPEILAGQMRDCVQVIREDYPLHNPSAFVEDSILLGGSRSQISKLLDLRLGAEDRLAWGCQLTFDLANRNMDLVDGLANVGLKYVFLGLETIAEEIATRMSKNLSKTPWEFRAGEGIRNLSQSGIAAGVALLFGLGETQIQRFRTIDLIAQWQQRFGNPQVVSLNWAVQHPLQTIEPSQAYTYLDWPVSSPDFVDEFRHFGEASNHYPIFGVTPPELVELRELNRHISASIAIGPHRTVIKETNINEIPNPTFTSEAAPTTQIGHHPRPGEGHPLLPSPLGGNQENNL